MVAIFLVQMIVMQAFEPFFPFFSLIQAVVGLLYPTDNRSVVRWQKATAACLLTALVLAAVLALGSYLQFLPDDICFGLAIVAAGVIKLACICGRRAEVASLRVSSPPA